MSRVILAVVVLLALAAPAWAQTAAPITSYELQVYLAGVDPQAGGAPLQTSAIPLTALTCGLPIVPAPVGTVVNPRFIRFADPANPTTADCQVDRSTFLLALPLGTGYRGTLTALYVGGVTARSATSNSFGLASVPPAVPARVGFLP